MKLPQMTPVKSTNVKAIGHSDDGLFVEFHKSGVYRYPDVPHTMFERGLMSDSPGGWLRSEIMGKFEGGRFDASSDD